MTDLLAELGWRGFVQHSTPGLEAQLQRGPCTLYCGFDPTAPSLQLGNLMPLMLLRHFQLRGHRPIVLMGGGTGLIGDPSGRSSERPLLSRAQITENLQRQRDQMARFLDFGPGKSAALLLDNAKWLGTITLIDFLRDIGKHFTVNIMLQKESVKGRLEGGISYTEFSYMLLQSYDFLHLYRSYDCTVQVGGSDQWGNITAGVELIRRVAEGEAHGLVAPLVTTAAGKKFGKTEEGAIWLDSALTSPYKLYQFWVNTDDRDVGGYLRLFTLRGRDEIDSLAAQHATDPTARRAQHALARDITERVHGRGAVDSALAASGILFGDFDPRKATEHVFDTLAGEVPTAALPTADGLSLVDAVVRAGLAKSKGEARRQIEQGGVYLNQQREQDPARTLGPDDWIAGRNALLRRGKKDYALLRIG